MSHPPNSSIVLLARGADQPGVLDEISKFVLEHGAVIDSLKVVTLAGQFAMLLLLRGDRATLAGLQAASGSAGARMGLTLELLEALDATPAAGHPYILRCRGPDEALALGKIGHLFRALRINIDLVETHHEGGMQVMELSFTVARDMPVTNLKEYLDQLLSPVSVKFELSPG